MADKIITARNLLKYSGVFLLCGWMFFLGVLVGRGTAPVSFDTKSFQEKLAAIAGVKAEKKKIEKKSGLDFYEMLKKPVSAIDAKYPESIEIAGSADYKVKGKNNGKISEKGTKIKKSRKTMSMALHGEKIKKSGQINSGYKNIKHGDGFNIVKHGDGLNTAVSDDAVVYTIQIAACRDLNDAVKLMENLKEKGYTAYRTMGEKDGKIWHRVRIGSFMNRKKAMQFEKQLESKQLKGIIVRKSKKDKK